MGIETVPEPADEQTLEGILTRADHVSQDADALRTRLRRWLRLYARNATPELEHKLMNAQAALAGALVLTARLDLAAVEPIRPRPAVLEAVAPEASEGTQEAPA